MAWNNSVLTGKERLNIAYDYKNEVLSRNISRHLLRVPIINYFTIYLNDYFVNLINTTKVVRIFRVFSVNKDYQYIN